MTRLSKYFFCWLLLVPLVNRGASRPLGIEELSRLYLLPQFKNSAKVASISSYDRSGGNDDGFSGKYSFVRKDEEGLILADLKGPGVIYRIWTPTPSDDQIEFLFDGETKPRLQTKFRELFLGHHPALPQPFVGFGAGGYYCYVPLPFAKSCVVRIRAAKVQFYQINYALYGEEESVATFDPNFTPTYLEQRTIASELWNSAGSELSRYTAPPGSFVRTSRSHVALEAHSSKTVFQADRGGRIVGLRVSPAAAMSGKARDLVLRITFDGKEPSVLCPLGDFFGYAWGQPGMRSLLVGTSLETNYCFYPMPFDREAKVELVSERSNPVELQVEVMHADVARATDEGWFQAVWRRENPTRLGTSYTFLKTQGRGHLVGVVLQAQGYESGKTLFFEGDDETTIDGDLVIHGTGSEDFFNGGWYDVPDRWEKRCSFPLSGCLGYDKHLGRTGGYRLFLGDAYAYRENLQQQIEHSGEKNNIPTDYCSVTYFYADQQSASGITLPTLSERGVTDLQEIVFPAWWQLPIAAWSFEHASLARRVEKIGEQEVRFLSFRAEGQDWFGPHFLSPSCEVPASGDYDIFIEAVSGPAQAKVQLFQNENPVADPVDFYADSLRLSGRVVLGRLRLNEGKNALMLKLVGKSERSSGLGLDLISVTCRRAPQS